MPKFSVRGALFALSLATAASLTTTTFAQTKDAGAPKPLTDAGTARPLDAGEIPPPSHKHMNAMGMEGPPEDSSQEDPTLPPGSIAVTILDPSDRPIPHQEVVLGIVKSSVQQGESRERKVFVTDDHGVAHMDHLETSSGMAYRVRVETNGAAFWAMPFRLPTDKGMRVSLHVFPVSSSMAESNVFAEVIVYVELRDDRIQFQEAIKIFNTGQQAWVPPKNLVFPLPQGFTALNGIKSMTDQAIEAAPDGAGAQLKGTFAPGTNAVEFRYQLPFDQTPSIDLSIGMPPQVIASRVMVTASGNMKVAVAGFEPALPSADNLGNRILVTHKELLRGQPFIDKVDITISDIPVPGPTRFYVTLACGAVLLFALYQFLTRKPSSAPLGAEREEILRELEELEEARKSGAIGPKTYERARREIVDALARTLSVPS